MGKNKRLAATATGIGAATVILFALLMSNMNPWDGYTTELGVPTITSLNATADDAGQNLTGANWTPMFVTSASTGNFTWFNETNHRYLVVSSFDSETDTTLDLTQTYSSTITEGANEWTYDSTGGRGSTGAYTINSRNSGTNDCLSYSYTGTLTAPFFVELSFKRGSNIDNNNMAIIGQWNTTSQRQWQLLLNGSNRLRVLVSADGTSSAIDEVGSNPLQFTIGQYYHVLYIYGATNSTLYINGTKFMTIDRTNDALFSSASNALTLGGWWTTNQCTNQGNYTYDYFKIGTWEPTTAEIDEWYDAWLDDRNPKLMENSTITGENWTVTLASSNETTYKIQNFNFTIASPSTTQPFLNFSITDDYNDVVVGNSVDLPQFVKILGRYVFTSSNNDDEFTSFNMTDPYSITARGSYANAVIDNTKGMDNYKDIMFVAGFNADRVSAINISGNTPVLISNTTNIDVNPFSLDGAYDVAVIPKNGNVFVAVSSQTDDTITIINWSTPSEPSMFSYYTASASPCTVDGAKTLIYDPNRELLFVSAQADAAVTILNTSEINDLSVNLTCLDDIADNTPPYSLETVNDMFYDSAKELLYAPSSADNEVTVLDVSIPTNIATHYGLVDTDNNMTTASTHGVLGIYMMNDYLFLANDDVAGTVGQISIYNVSDTASFVAVQRYNTTITSACDYADIQRIRGNGNYLYAVGGASGGVDGCLYAFKAFDGAPNTNLTIWSGTEWVDADTGGTYIEFRCTRNEKQCAPTNQTATQSIYQVCNNGTVGANMVQMSMNQTYANVALLCDYDNTYVDAIPLGTTNQTILYNLVNGKCANLYCWSDYSNPSSLGEFDINVYAVS